jgi:hypothetical protein
MASEALTGPEARRRRPHGGSVCGRLVLGMLAVQVVDDWASLFARWKRLAKAKPFWS